MLRKIADIFRIFSCFTNCCVKLRIFLRITTQLCINYHNLINLSRNSFFFNNVFFSNGFYNFFFTIYDLCAVIIIINLLSIYIIKNQRLTNISHKVVVTAESLLYVIGNKKYSIIIVSLIWYINFYVFVCAVVRITNQINKYVTHRITLQIKSRCSKPTNQIAFKDGQTDGKILII
jgi:hypothetical protein